MLKRGVVASRTKAQALIADGKICFEGTVVRKAEHLCQPRVEILISDRRRFVSRGGQELAGALTDSQLSPADKVCVDVGTITSGFTDCLLQAGAVRVYAIDTGFKPCDLVIVDVSFISLPKLLLVIITWLAREGEILAVIKSQFELGPDVVNRRGVIRNPEKRLAAVVPILQVARSFGLRPQRITRSCLPGATGNEEYFIRLGWNFGEERTPACYVSSQAA